MPSSQKSCGHNSTKLYTKTKFDVSKLSDAKYLCEGINVVSNENNQLRSKLLELITDYKLLKQFVLSNNDYNYKKRSFTDIEDDMQGIETGGVSAIESPITNGTSVSPSPAKQLDVDGLDIDLALSFPDASEMSDMLAPDLLVPDILSPDLTSELLAQEMAIVSSSELDVDLDDDLGGLNLKLNTADRHDTVNIDDFIDDEELLDEELDDFHDDMDSPLLSRTSSPLDDENHSLMATLTRSTTVSTNNSFMEKMPTTISMQQASSQQSRFFELPKFIDNSNKNFKNLSRNFDVLQQDQYNLINDFLEEKLINNDLNYYENLKAQDD